LCRAINREDLVDDPRAANMRSRQEHSKTLFGEVREALAKCATAPLLERAREYGVPMAPVNDIDDLLEDPQALHNGTLFEVADDPGLGPMRQLRSPPRFSRTPTTLRRLPPRHGEHTRALLREAGLDDSEIDALIESRAVVEPRTAD
jgi:CoA:oxalate CoA-transferase